MHADTTARRSGSSDQPLQRNPVGRMPGSQLVNDLFRPLGHRIDPAEIVALLTEGADKLPALMVKGLEDLRELVGDFVVKNMNTPQPHYGFNAKPVEPVDVSGLEKALWGAHSQLEDLYRTFDPSEASSLAYRGVIVDVKAQLTSFLLQMKTHGLDEGLNALEKPAFLGACISLEAYLGQTIQRAEGIRIEQGSQRPTFPRT